MPKSSGFFRTIAFVFILISVSCISCNQNLNVGSSGYTLTYNGNGSSAGTAPTDGKTYQQGDKATVLGNTGSLVRAGYNFTGWNSKDDGTGTS